MFECLELGEGGRRLFYNCKGGSSWNHGGGGGATLYILDPHFYGLCFA